MFDVVSEWERLNSTNNKNRLASLSPLDEY